MFFQKDRVEQDLARIREANLPEAAEQAKKKALHASKSKAGHDRIGIQDVFAMIIAVLSLIIPYVLAFVGVMAAVILGLYYWMR